MGADQRTLPAVKANAATVLTHRHVMITCVLLSSGAQTITGILSGTMTHDESYNFLRMGRNLERADMTTRIIDVRSATLVPQMTKILHRSKTSNGWVCSSR